jgi:hypothetical protein
VFRYQRNGTPARNTLGNYPTMTLREAYEALAELTKRLNRGEAPRAAKAEATAGIPGALSSGVAGPTVGDLATEFTRRYAQRERKRPLQAEQSIEANILKPWRHRLAKSITRRDGVPRSAFCLAGEFGAN